ncbi:hypothetical protein Tco_0643700, partial [Tanacetum coccineum]
NTMAEQNVPAQPPTRTDEQIVPRSQWLTIGKSNYRSSAQKIQKNPVFSDIITNNIHRRPESAFMAQLEIINLRKSQFVPKVIQRITPQESASVLPATKRLSTPKKPTTTYTSKQTKPAPPPSKNPPKLGNHLKKREKEKSDDADLERAIKLSMDPAFLPQGRAPIGGVKIRDPVSEATPKLHEVVGKGKAVVTEEQVAHSLVDLSKKKRTTDQFILVRRDQTPPDSTTGPSSQPDDDTSDKVIHESSSTSDSERTESETETAAPKDDKDQGEVDSSTVTSGVSIPVSDPVKAHEALAGPDPEPMKEDQTGSDSGKLHVSLAGPNPEHIDDEFLATAYPKYIEKPEAHYRRTCIDDNQKSFWILLCLPMKNLDDTFNFGDQFSLYKPTER